MQHQASAVTGYDSHLRVVVAAMDGNFEEEVEKKIQARNNVGVFSTNFSVN
tara:strand:- start:73 stop:225 length:153 start_codon:yes stop_codon:yes gene_type:complete